MRFPLALLLGLVFGVMILLAFQAVVVGVRSIPGIDLIPGIADFLSPRQAAAPSPTPAPPPTPVPSPTPRVIQIDLERARMVHKTVYGEMGYTVHLTSKAPSIEILGRGFFDKEMLIIVSGTCRAGVDYERNPADIRASGTRVSVAIPEPEIFGCDVTSVEYFDGNGLFPAPTELYNQMYGAAIQRIQAQAEQSDLLEQARRSATSQTELHLRRLGFEQVSVEIEPAH
jgi:hypothetical protein